MKITLTLRCQVTGYTNTHDGYCSGNECSLEDVNEERHFTTQVSIPEFKRLVGASNGRLIVATQTCNDIFRKDLRALQKSYEGYEGSFYCENSSEAVEKGAEQHNVDLYFSNFRIISIAFHEYIEPKREEEEKPREAPVETRPAETRPPSQEVKGLWGRIFG